MNIGGLHSIAGWFLNRSRSVKQLIVLFSDFIAVVLALWLSFSLRLSTLFVPPIEQLWLFAVAPILAIPVFIRFGLYRAVMRYIGFEAIGAIVKAVALFTLLFTALVVLAGEHSGVIPRTVYGINAVLLLLFVGGSRLVARWVLTWQRPQQRLRAGAEGFVPPVIIYGAGEAGVQLAAMLRLSRQMRPVAFIDDDENLQKNHINGLTVHAPSKLSRLIEKYRVRDVLLAMPSVNRAKRRRVIESIEHLPVHVRTLPDLTGIAQGKVRVSDIQEVDIADVLGRDAVAPDSRLLARNIENHSVMVTGAGGSIGAELCRQIIKHHPKCLVLFEISEFALYHIEQSLKEVAPEVEVIAVLGSVLDQSRLEALFERFAVNTIYHAAAYKHVPMVERNTTEGVRNNVLGTLRCAQAAVAHNVDTFVLVSTDKAVRPTNTMGASKRLAELVLQALANDSTLCRNTRFTMVRFGNVLGSSGSVVPLFRQQIANGGPLTVTDPEVIRYFMTIPEAAELVIQAGAMGQGGDVFVLDMGESVKIIDLARRLLHLSGLTERTTKNPDGDIEIRITGLRPGEKLYEELLIGANVSQTCHPKIMRAEERVIDWQALSPIIDTLEQAIASRDYSLIRQLFSEHVDGYKPQCDIGDWLSPELAVTSQSRPAG